MLQPDDEYLTYDFSFLDQPAVKAGETAPGPVEAEECEQLREDVFEKNPEDRPLQELEPLSEEVQEYQQLEGHGFEGEAEELSGQVAADNLQKNFIECAKALSLCSLQLKQLDSVKKEKDKLATQIAELNDYNEMLREQLWEARRRSVVEQVEKKLAVERQREAAQELHTLKGLYDDTKKKAATADMFKEKFDQLKKICDKFQEQRQDWAKKFQECVRVIKMKNNEITMVRESREQLREAKQTTAQELRSTQKLKPDLVRLLKTLTKVQLPASARNVLAKMRKEAGIQDNTPIGLQQPIARIQDETEEESDDDLCATLEGMVRSDQPLVSMTMPARPSRQSTGQTHTPVIQQPAMVGGRRRRSCPLTQEVPNKERPNRSKQNKALLWRIHERNPVQVQENLEEETEVERPQMAQSSTSISSMESQAPPRSQKNHEAILLSAPLPPPSSLPKLKRNKTARHVPPAPLKATPDDRLYKIPETKKEMTILEETLEVSESKSSVPEQPVHHTRSLSRREASLIPLTPPLSTSSRREKITEINLFPQSPGLSPPPQLSPMTSPAVAGRVTRSRASSVCLQPATPLQPAPTPIPKTKPAKEKPSSSDTVIQAPEPVPAQLKPKKTLKENPFPLKNTQGILDHFHKLQAELYPRIEPLPGQGAENAEIREEPGASFLLSDLEPLPTRVDDLSTDENAEIRQELAPKKAKPEILNESTATHAPEPLFEKPKMTVKKRVQNRVQKTVKKETQVSDTVIQAPESLSVQKPVNLVHKTVKTGIQAIDTVIPAQEPPPGKVDSPVTKKAHDRVQKTAKAETQVEDTVTPAPEPLPAELDGLWIDKNAGELQVDEESVVAFEEEPLREKFDSPVKNRVRKTVKSEILESATILKPLFEVIGTPVAENPVQKTAKTEIQVDHTVIPVQKPLPTQNRVRKTAKVEDTVIQAPDPVPAQLKSKKAPTEKPFPSPKTQGILDHLHKLEAELYPQIEPLPGQNLENAEIGEEPAKKRARLEILDESTVTHVQEPVSEKHKVPAKKNVQNRVKAQVKTIKKESQTPNRVQQMVKTEIQESAAVIPVPEPLPVELGELWIDESVGELQIDEGSTASNSDEEHIPEKFDSAATKSVQMTVNTEIQVEDTVNPVRKPLTAQNRVQKSIKTEIHELDTVTPARRPLLGKITPKTRQNSAQKTIKETTRSETKEVEIIEPRRQRIRGHEEPVNLKQKKALPEALLATVLEMPDLDTVRTRFSEQDMAAIHVIEPQKFGEVMAQVAIRLQTGNMWTLVMTNFRKKSTDRFSNKTEDTLIFLANELSTGSGNLWAPFIRALWLSLVSQPVHDVSFCCKLVRLICAALNVEVQLEETGAAEIGPDAASFVKNLIEFVAFSYPSFLGQSLVYILHLLPVEYVKFLGKEGDLLKILVLYTDDVTRTILMWSWNNFCPEEELVLPMQNEITSGDDLFYSQQVDEELEFTATGALQISSTTARAMKLRALFQSSPAGFLLLKEELQLVENLLKMAAELYVRKSDVWDPAFGSLFQLAGNVTVPEAREICLRLHFLASLLPTMMRMGSSRAKDIYVRRIEDIAEQSYTIQSAIRNDSRHLTVQKDLLLKSFDNFLRLIGQCTRRTRR